MAMMMELCWWPLSSWLSPGAALFVLFNVLVGAVAVMSTREHQPAGCGEPAASRRRLRRSASSMVLDRLRSFTVFPVHPAAAECYLHTPQEDEEDEHEVGGSASSHPAQTQSAPADAEALAADDAAPMSEMHKDEAEPEEEKSTCLDEPSVESPRHHAPEALSPAAPSAAANDDGATVHRVDTPGKKKKKKQRRRRARARGQETEEVEGKAELNARAELFIRQFREDLQLQRLNSIVNYTRALRHRAAAAASEEN